MDNNNFIVNVYNVYRYHKSCPSYTIILIKMKEDMLTLVHNFKYIIIYSQTFVCFVHFKLLLSS